MDISMNNDDAANYNKTKLAIHKQFRQQESTFFKQILVSGIEKGEIREMDEKELDIMVFVLLSSFRGLKREIVEENNNRDEKSAAKTITMVVMNGLRR
jgi:hypothetical protein